MTVPLEYTHKLIHTTPLRKPQIYPQLPRTLQIWQRITPMHLVPNTHIIHAQHIHKITPPSLHANTEAQKHRTATYGIFTSLIKVADLP